MAHRRRGDVIAKKATTIAIVNQKGGTAKTTTCENLGIGLAMEGKKVLLVDVDPQGSLTISMGLQDPDQLPTTLSTLMQKAMHDQPVQPGEGVLHHAEGVDLIPANIELAGMEVALVNSMNREKMLKQVLDSAKREYDYEMHLLLKEEQTAAYSVEIWKRFRKWGGIPTGLTQNVKDLLSSREVENIFENSDMIIMLNQAAGDRQILAKQLNISPHQLSYVTHSGEGEGLLFFGNVILPFVDRFPTDLELYRIMTTKLGEVSEGAQK